MKAAITPGHLRKNPRNRQICADRIIILNKETTI